MRNMPGDAEKIGLMQVIRQFQGSMKGGMKPTNEVIEGFCQREHIEKIPTVTELDDAIFQLEMDEAMARILPDFLRFMADNLMWTPDISLALKHEEEKAAKTAISNELIRLMEREAIPYFFVEHILAFYGNGFKGILETTNQVTKNKAKRVYEAVAMQAFGHEDMTMADIAEFDAKKSE